MTITFKQSLLAVALLGSSALSHANLITNGGFEDELTGWTCPESDGFCEASTTSGTPREGASYAWAYENDGRAPGTLSQSFATDVGSTYSLSLWVGSSSASPSNNSGVNVGDYSNSFSFTGTDDENWQLVNATFEALDTTTTLQLLFDTDPGTGQLWFDDVSVEFLSTGNGGGNGGAAVPAPATPFLIGLGLLGLTGLRRRK